MNSKIFFSTALLGLAFTLGGCGSGSSRDDASPAPVVEGVDGRGTEVSGAREGGAWTGSALQGEAALLGTRVLYFDFDRSEIRPEYYDVLRAHAQRLIREPNSRLVIEGHADERGSREYNIALGERRANAVLSFLRAEGVAGGQLATVSYGEEQPRDLGHDETAWSANRRAELVYE